MIPDNDTIVFKPADVPDLRELAPRPRKKPRRHTPPPVGWRPFGVEW